MMIAMSLNHLPLPLDVLSPIAPLLLLRLTARLTPLRRFGKAFLFVEILLACRPYKSAATIDAG
jgi:hypothetical protein